MVEYAWEGRIVCESLSGLLPCWRIDKEKAIVKERIKEKAKKSKINKIIIIATLISLSNLTPIKEEEIG